MKYRWVFYLWGIKVCHQGGSTIRVWLTNNYSLFVILRLIFSIICQSEDFSVDAVNKNRIFQYYTFLMKKTSSLRQNVRIFFYMVHVLLFKDPYPGARESQTWPGSATLFLEFLNKPDPYLVYNFIDCERRVRGAATEEHRDEGTSTVVNDFFASEW